MQNAFEVEESDKLIREFHFGFLWTTAWNASILRISMIFLLNFSLIHRYGTTDGTLNLKKVISWNIFLVTAFLSPDGVEYWFAGKKTHTYLLWRPNDVVFTWLKICTGIVWTNMYALNKYDEAWKQPQLTRLDFIKTGLFKCLLV